MREIRVGFDLLQNLPAVVFRQVEVEQDQVWTRRFGVRALAVEEFERLLAVVRDMQGVADPVVLERLLVINSSPGSSSTSRMSMGLASMVT